ncbi:hypothetical protein LN042_31340 [Kitasatospora sp. RB6PN24]|uniref:hypothetical protein n=1 Tax=Kitasatospora humi TaxID=2893891 RepID=UPI001E41F397|nr:hypothetical protein [Kitasatospora humi]MCC9311508.1 hypothetical protein [Kitasatospora humi]
MAVLLPGGGLNARANFATARDRSLVEFLAEHGYLPIGVTPREDAADARDASEAAAWGLAAHRTDVEQVLTAIVEHLGLPQDLLGHSAGAALALDLAAQPGCAAERVLVLDTTGPYDPRTEPERSARASALCDEFQQRLAAGELLLDPGLKAAFAATDGSPQARERLTHALTRTSELPGPANWIYHRGHSAGGESLDLDVWARAMAALGSGMQPVALLRDLAALWGGRDEVYRIDWSAIRAEVVWLNGGSGRGDHDLAARLIRAGGARVDYRVVPGFGHGDMVWAPQAVNAVWPLLLADQ